MFWICSEVLAVFHNDACWLELLPAFSPSTSIAYEYDIKKENYLSYNWVNNENISTILSWYTNIEYLWKNNTYLFFLHENKIKRAPYSYWEIWNLSIFMDLNLNKEGIVYIDDYYLYYKNPEDNNDLYKIKTNCNESNLRWANTKKIDDYTFLFADNNWILPHIFLRNNIDWKVFSFWSYFWWESLYDLWINIDEFLFYWKEDNVIYYTLNWKTYRKYIDNYKKKLPEEVYYLSLDNYLFNDLENIYYYNNYYERIDSIKKDWTSYLWTPFFPWKFNYIGLEWSDYYYSKYDNLESSYYIYKTNNPLNWPYNKLAGPIYSNNLEWFKEVFLDYPYIVYLDKNTNEVYKINVNWESNNSSSSSWWWNISNPIWPISQNNTDLSILWPVKTINLNDYLENNKLVYTPIVNKTQEWDPVMLHSWEFVYENTLLSYPWVGLPFSFDITYKNQSRYSWPIWNNFDFSYNQYLTIEENGDVKYYDWKLGVTLFEYDEENNEFNYNTNTKSQLFFDGDFYKIVKNNNLTYTFNLDLKIDWIEDNSWNYISINYDNNKKIESIIDTLWNEYLFSYKPDTRLEKITDFNQNEVIFDYYNTDDEVGWLYDLKSITLKNWNEEKTTSFEYTKWYDFDNSHNITKLIDFAWNIYVENTYDSFDRVNVQKFGEWDITYNYTLSDDESYILKNEVITRVWDKFIYTYNSWWQILSKEIFKKSWESYEYTYEYDSNNNLIKETNPLWNWFTYSYDSNNNLIERRQKTDTSLENSTNDIVVSFEYDDIFNKVTKEILPNGTNINYTLDNFWNVVEKQTISWNIETLESFEYNNLWQLVSKTDWNWNISNFEYINWNLSKIIKIWTDENIETNFEYDSKWNITKITDGEWNETNLNYDDFNLLVSQITPSWIETNFEYNSLNKKTKETIILNDTTNKITSFEYDILDNPTKVTTNIDWEKNKTIVTKYDNDNRIIETQNWSNAKNTFLYDENWNITKKITILDDNTNISTSYVYDLNDRLVKQINPNGSEINFTYDLFDRLIKATNSDNSYTTNTYDNMWNLLETKSYDSSDNLVSKTSFEYDKLSRKTKQTNHLLEESKQIITSYSYDNNSNMLSQTNALNQTTSFVYDSFNRLVKTTDNLWNIIEYKYNKNDKVIEETLTWTNGKILKKEYYYDSDGRLEILHDDNWKSSNYWYNKLWELQWYSDWNSTISYTYDLLGNKTSEDSSWKIINYEYDENSNMTKLIDANWNETNYAYDELNRLVKQTYADNSYTSYEYDINSNVSKKIDWNWTIINYIYDNQNRLTEKNIINWENVLGITKENFEYDSLWRLTKTTNNEWSETLFSYDSLNRLTSETQNGKLVNYTYDSLWNRTSISIDWKTTSYNYDSNSRLETISRENSELVRYNYDSLNLLSQTYWNWQTTTYWYDENYNRLTNLNTLNKNYEYMYTQNNLISSNGYEYYNYDENNQLTQVSFNTRFVNKDFIDYSYDQMWNRLNEMYGRINKKWNINYFKDFEYTTNNLHQYTNKIIYNPNNEEIVDEIIQEPETNSWATNEEEITESEPLVELEWKLIYDKNWNMIWNMLNNKRQYIYSYDYKNRLVKVEKTIYKSIEWTETNEIQEIVKIIQYKYDNLDRRIQKIYNNWSYTNYYYSNKDIILEENYTKPNTNGISKIKTSKYFINGNNIDDVLAMEKVDYKTRKVQEEYINKKGQTKTRNITENYTETNTYYYHKNHLNSIVAITDNLGNILEEYEYDVFGKPYSKNTTTWKVTNLKASTIWNTRLFTWREYERWLQLYYNRARYYNPELGRFISRDPIDISDDVNLYSYVGNNGVNYTDPLWTEKKAQAEQFRIDFVKAYDDYLEIKNKIYNLWGWYDLWFLVLSSNKKEQLKLEFELKESIAKELHYKRNSFNTLDVPDNVSNLDMNKWLELPYYKSVFHQKTAVLHTPNSKFISLDWHQELIYMHNWFLEKDIEDIWTYNFYSPLEEAVLHSKYDIDTYYEWWNWPNDSTNKITRRFKF